MPQEVPDRDDLGAMFQEVGRKGMPQTMATRGDPGGLGIALHFLLDRFDRQRLLATLAVPKDIALGARLPGCCSRHWWRLATISGDI